ncbi:MAG: DNA-binding protein [Ilumatobacteraceae bacterium]|nr:DNA-binding protein [Ilumatobacteraceae bacterium]
MKVLEGATIAAMSTPIHWLSTAEAAKYLGITPRTLYRFIDEGQIAGYRFGRVIRLKQDDVDLFIEASRITPGTLEHLYPEVVGSADKGTDSED